MVGFIVGLFVGAGIGFGFAALVMIKAEENDRELRK